MSRLRDLSARLVFDRSFAADKAYCIEDVADIFEDKLKDDTEKIGRVIEIGLELGLLTKASVSDGKEYFVKLRPDWKSECSGALLINTAIFEANKLTKETASLVRQARIVQAAQESGDGERVEELIGKWRTAGREALDQLYVLKTANGSHGEEGTMGSKSRFIRALGLLPADFYSDFEDLGPEESEGASYSDSENFHGHGNQSSKRIKEAESDDD